MKNKFVQLLSAKLSLRLIISFVLFSAAAVGFVALAEEVREGDTLQIDQAILTAINSQSTQFFDTIFVVLTDLGGFYAVVALTLGIAILLWLRRSRSRAAFLLLSVAGAALINLLFKTIFERERPDLWEHLIIEHHFSFPSGHAMASAALATAVMIIFWRTRFRWLVVAIAALYALLIGFSRLYLGVHYPTDILAGWVVSIAWVILVGSILLTPILKGILRAIIKKDGANDAGDVAV